jgi:hypothetical protein
VYFTDYSKTDIAELTSDLYTLLDLEVRYELPNKLGSLQLTATNLLDQSFTRFTELMVLNRVFPYRRVALEFRLTP